MPDTGDQGTGMLAAIVVSEAAVGPIKTFIFMYIYIYIYIYQPTGIALNYALGMLFIHE